MRVFNVVFDYTQSRLRFSVGNETLGSISENFEIYTPTEEKAEFDAWEWVGISSGILVMVALMCLVACCAEKKKKKKREFAKIANMNLDRNDGNNLNETYDDDDAQDK